jgi:hypothetical protein
VQLQPHPQQDEHEPARQDHGEKHLDVPGGTYVKGEKQDIGYAEIADRLQMVRLAAQHKRVPKREDPIRYAIFKKNVPTVKAKIIIPACIYIYLREYIPEKQERHEYIYDKGYGQLFSYIFFCDSQFNQIHFSYP